MTTHAAVGINDDLPSGQTTVAVRTADLELARRIDVILHVPLEQFLWQQRFDDFFDDGVVALVRDTWQQWLGPLVADLPDVDRIIEDPNPPVMKYDPQHPDADEKGYVAMPNINVMEEMVNMISASRSYKNNVEIINTTKDMLLQTLSLGR